MTHAAHIIVGVLLILCGVSWAFLWLSACSMADRPTDMFREVLVPMAPGIAVVAIGVFVLCCK